MRRKKNGKPPEGATDRVRRSSSLSGTETDSGTGSNRRTLCGVNFRVLLRLIRLQWLLVKHGAAQLISMRRISGPQRLRMLLEEVGGSFLKFGQVLSLQPDILPRAYCDALFDLLDRVPSFAYADVERTIIEDLGRTPADIFDSFDAQPIASASIGQVHVASLDGHRVAVKVRRPTVERDFESDLNFMRGLSRVIRGLRLRRLEWLANASDEFIGWTREELDYRFEALTGAGTAARGQMLIYDALYGENRTITLARRPECRTCGAPN